MKRDKVEKFSASGLKTSGVPLKNPERVRGGKKEQPETYEGEKVTKWASKMFEGEGGAGALHWQRGPKVLEGIKEVTVWKGWGPHKKQ